MNWQEAGYQMALRIDTLKWVSFYTVECQFLRPLDIG